MGSYILSLDAGTTSSRALLFDHKTNVVATAQKEFKQYYPKAGWVEHDAHEIFDTQLLVAKQVIEKSGISPSEISAIGITNQRETIVCWDKTTGQALYKAIVWQDRRTAEFCNQLKAKGKAELIRKKTGLVIDAYFSASKIRWMINNVKGVKEKLKNNTVCFGTIDTWLLFKLTEGKSFKTDATNASRTMLYNIHSDGWDQDLLELFEIPVSALPEVLNSSDHYGEATLLDNIPICALIGDQQSALFGQLCTTKGEVKNTYGTGCFMLLNTGKNAVESAHNLLTTVALKLENTITYALEGSVFVGGALIQWLRDELNIIENASDIEALAKSVEDSLGVCIVPAFTGLGAPYWSQETRGSILGLTRGSSKAHIARAALESIALQVNDLLSAMQKDLGESLSELKVDGGASANNLMMQMQADFCALHIIRAKNKETTAAGAAFLAGLKTGVYKSIEDLKQTIVPDRTFNPLMSEEQRTKKTNRWLNAVKATQSF